MCLAHTLYISVFCVSDCSAHERETQRILNKQSGLRDIDSFNELDGKWSNSKYTHTHTLIYTIKKYIASMILKFNFITEGEHIEMGGIIDAEKGALRTTNDKMVETEGEDGFQKKKIIQVTDETNWLGEEGLTVDKTALENPVKQPEKDSSSIKETNPLYSDQDYDVGDYQEDISSTAKLITPSQQQGLTATEAGNQST